MSDPLEPIFSGLRGQSPPAPFASSDAVRRRGRQRARRQAAVASAAVLAVIGLGAGAVATVMGGPGQPPPVGAPTGTPTTTEQPTPAPMPTVVPERWLLTADDLGPGQWQTGWEPEWTEGPDQWRWEGVCPGYSSEDYPSLQMRADLKTITWTDGPFDESDVPRWVHEIVDLFDSGDAAQRHLDDIRAVLALCDQAPESPVPAPVLYEVIDTGFAGDESMLVRERAVSADGTEAVDAYTAVVRVGSAVVTLYAQDAGLAMSDVDYLLELAPRAAERLR